MKWFDVKAQAANENTAEISVYGEISAWDITAADFVKQVQSLGSVAQINLSINSPGGSVFDALTMFNFLRRTGAEIIVHIDGLAASAASLLAMAGDKIIMPKNAMMMIHNPWVFAMGNANDLREQADVLDKVANALFITYQARTGIDETLLSEMLATDTWLTAQECFDIGFCDEIVDTVPVKALYDIKKLPEHVRAIFAQASDTDIDSVLGDGSELEPEQAPETPLTDLEDDDFAAEAEAKALAYAQSVIEMCAIAGMSDKAAGFIKAKTALGDIGAKLLSAKVNASVEIVNAQKPVVPFSQMSLTEKTELFMSNRDEYSRLQKLES